MRCVKPLSAWKTDGGEVIFHDRGGRDRPLTLRCGQCIHCRLERSRQWAVRCMHEASLHRASSFVTLTYDDEHLLSPSLDYKDYQLFMRRARRKLGPFRFFMCGEYGEQNWRPHFHACLFGVHFEDRQMLSTSGPLWTSKTLQSLWPYGHSSFGAVTFESAAYVARYVVKKVTGGNADEHYSRVVESTGELVQLEPEFCRMSLKPGIGRPWFDRFKSEVFPRDRVVVRGQETRPPRRYYEWLKSEDGFMADEVEYARQLKAAELEGAEGPSLESMGQVTEARLAQRKRVL